MDFCKKILKLMQEDREKNLSQILEILYTENAVRKEVKKVYFGYCSKLKSLFSWEDILTEAIIEVGNEIKEGRGPKHKGKCPYYIATIAKRFCMKYIKKDSRFDKILDILRIIMKLPDNNVNKEKLKAILDKLSRKCRLLLEFFLTHSPPLKEEDKIELSKELTAIGYNVAPKSIAAEITKCKMRFRKFLGDNLRDLFDDE